MIDPMNAVAQRFAQQGMPQTQALRGAADPGLAEANGGSSFADTLKDALEEVSTVQDTANQTMEAFLRGEPVELHEVMAATEEAGIALEMLIEIRNKMTDAYRTLINMQS